MRGLFAQDARAYAVVGTGFYELFADGTTVKHGDVVDNGGLASMCSNGTAGFQVLIIAGFEGYVWNFNTNAFAQITDPDFIDNPFMCDFMDGYGIVSQFSRRTFQISALEDFTSWDALDVAERSEGSDDIAALIRSHRDIWILGTKTSEVWYDNGDALFPFAPIQGVFIEHGCVSSSTSWTVARVAETVMWLEQGELGNGLIVQANGYTPQQVSTYAISLQIEQGFSLQECRAWAYQEDGHTFYVLLTPGASTPDDTTKVLDLTEGEWHERATWNSTLCQWQQHRAQCHCFAFNKHLVGDRSTPTIYHLSTAYNYETLVGA